MEIDSYTLLSEALPKPREIQVAVTQIVTVKTSYTSKHPVCKLERILPSQPCASLKRAKKEPEASVYN